MIRKLRIRELTRKNTSSLYVKKKQMDYMKIQKIENENHLWETILTWILKPKRLNKSTQNVGLILSLIE